MLADLSNAVAHYLQIMSHKLDWWFVLGVCAETLFALRFIVQWVASERAGTSVIPFSFWLLSIGGGMLLFLYAIARADPIYILGQGFGLLIYFRNVSLVLKSRGVNNVPVSNT